MHDGLLVAAVLQILLSDVEEGLHKSKAGLGVGEDEDLRVGKLFHPQSDGSLEVGLLLLPDLFQDVAQLIQHVLAEFYE